MALQLPVVLLLLATCQLAASGKVPHDQNDQSADSILQGRPFLKDDGTSRFQNDQSAEQSTRSAGKEDEEPIENEGKLFDKNAVSQGKPLENTANEKRFLGKVIDKVKQHVKKRYWTKQRYIHVLKELGILDIKEIKLFTASKDLIDKLKKSKNHVIDTFNKTQNGQCPQDEAMDQDMSEIYNLNDAEKKDNDDEAKVIENDDQDSKLDKIMREMAELNGNDDLPDNDQEGDLANILEDKDMTAKDDPEVVRNVEKRSQTVDLCHETFSTLYVLAYPAANLAYKIPTVHCPDKFCKSKALGVTLGKCAKKEKELLLYVINSQFQFIPKTVTCGCACECLHFKYLA